jgi:hypothetical protein
VERLATNDSRVKLINAPNGGIVDALNLGLEHCTAEFIARHDADDLAVPDRFSRQLTYLQANLDCIAVGCNVWYIDQGGKPTGARSNFNGSVAPDANSAPSKEPYILHPFLMLRREAIQSIGGYRYVFYAEDTDLYWRLLALGRLHNLPECLGQYRRHKNSVSSLSILNGRVAAVCSQLAALSFRRRERGQPDLQFDRSILDSYKSADGLGPILKIASVPLEDDEAQYLELAVAGKLLLALTFRPYLPNVADCRFMKRTIDLHLDSLSLQDRRRLRRWQGYVATRLILAGRLHEMMAICPPVIHLVTSAGIRVVKEIMRVASRSIRATLPE